MPQIKLKTVSRTSYFVIDGEDEFPVTFKPTEGEVIVKINGAKARVGYLSDDECEWDRGWYFDEFEQGLFFGRDPRKLGFDKRAADNPKEKFEELQAEHGADRVFFISYYEHGSCKYAPAGTEIDYDRWDTARGAAIYVAPGDCPDPQAYCESTMQEFTDWCNGAIYGVVTENFTRVGDKWEKDGNEDACWGHIGYEYAKRTLEEEMKDG